MSAELRDDFAEVVATEQDIHQAVERMAAQIRADYADQDLLLVGVLKGAVMIMADLARLLPDDVAMDWMAVSSYGAGTQSSGVVRILKDLDADITDRHVLIVEDIVDTGITLSWLLGNLRSRGAASVEVAALLHKDKDSPVDLGVKYIGMRIPDKFVVGYGLDYAEKYRPLPYVAALAPHVYGDDA